MLKSVYEVISEVSVKVANMRIENLKKIEAPSIMIAKTQENIDSWLNGTHKIGGLQQKYKSLRNAEVAEYQVKNTKGTYFKGKHETIAVKMVLTDGSVYFYDWFEGKFGKEVEMSFPMNIF